MNARDLNIQEFTLNVVQPLQGSGLSEDSHLEFQPDYRNSCELTSVHRKDRVLGSLI